MRIDIIGRSNPDSLDYWDGNWLEAEIRIETSGAKIAYGTNLRADDFQRFYGDLVKWKKELTKNVEFKTMEEGLYFKAITDSMGNIEWKGTAKLQPGTNDQSFLFETDDVSIDSIMIQVKIILDQYPVIENKG